MTFSFLQKKRKKETYIKPMWIQIVNFSELDSRFYMSFSLWWTPHLLSLLQIYLNFSSRLPVAPGPREESSSPVQRLNSVGSHSTATQPLLSNNDVFLEGTGPLHPPVWRSDSQQKAGILTDAIHLLRPFALAKHHCSCLTCMRTWGQWKTLINNLF